ncbi:MAG: VCBS repeat-containing protein [Cyclobacteriaceae bacterium]
MVVIVEDINGDFRPEIIVSQFLAATGNISILHNQSSSGNFDFSDQITQTVAGTLVNLKFGDLDGDRLPDIVATQLLGNSISIFLNKSGSSVQFASPQTITTVSHPWGIDFGDLDGDGKLDMVIASVTDKSLSVMNNNSTTGNLSFNQLLIPTTYITRNVKIADMDGDAKPDITFTSVDDNVNGIPASKVSIIRNASCMTPQVSPAGPLTICVGFPLTLTSTINGGASYQWYNNNVLIPGETNSTLSVTAAGKYSVKVTSESGACVQSSNSVDVTVNVGTALGSASPTNNGPVCLTGTLQLSVADVGATLYSWRGPKIIPVQD